MLSNQSDAIVRFRNIDWCGEGLHIDIEDLILRVIEKACFFFEHRQVEDFITNEIL